MTDVYELRDLKETIEEALEDLWNSRDERFRDKMIFGALAHCTSLVDEAGINRPHPYVEKFTHRDLKDQCVGNEELHKLEQWLKVGYNNTKTGFAEYMNNNQAGYQMYLKQQGGNNEQR